MCDFKAAKDGFNSCYTILLLISTRVLLINSKGFFSYIRTNFKNHINVITIRMGNEEQERRRTPMMPNIMRSKALLERSSRGYHSKM